MSKNTSIKKPIDPPFRWAGGKRKIRDQIRSHFPTYKTYHEPFVGSGTLFFAEQPSKAILSDLNPDLTAFFRALKNSPIDLYRRTEFLVASSASDLEDTYYSIRSQSGAAIGQPSDVDEDIRVAARFWYLINTCYNGLWRVNSKGEMNIPIGKDGKGIPLKPSLSDSDLTNWIELSCSLRDTEIECQHFTKAFDRVSEGDLVYCDPPYLGSYSSYAGRFEYDDHVKLRDLSFAAARRGATVIISNSDCGDVRDLWAGCEFIEIEVFRSISARSESRGKKAELLIKIN